MVKLSPTAALRQRAAKLRREGVEVFDFSAGELDLATPAHIVTAAIDAATKPENHHYGPTGGEDRLRQAIADRLTLRAAAPSTARTCWSPTVRNRPCSTRSWRC